ncbi:isochorismatase family protein [Microvirga terricola]|uniref:Isochorismatase family protein n=1 Tax=Microvirga terricola TaxID=2719797 RepID=A0ABX0VD26_9HYPH|nr:isochorismatase family protein [Microvirga terricola]NIX76865.1 isochorismatase family protein [Microvirga terricola]
MLLDAARSQLLVVDLQMRLLPAILESEKVIERTKVLLQAAGRLGVPVTVTEQYPRGLGSTVPAIADALPIETIILPKTSFSAAGDPAIAAHVAALRGQGRDQLLICGTEAHVCVLQSALGFRESGLHVFTIGDAISSRAAHSIDATRGRLLHAGCHWVTMEMVVFEWLEQAGTEDFRTLSPLLK